MFCCVNAIFPWQDVATAVRHFNSQLGWFSRLGQLWCRLCWDLRLYFSTGQAFGRCVQIWNPAQEQREVCNIGNVPILGFGVPAGSKRFGGIFLSERGDQIDSHRRIILGALHHDPLPRPDLDWALPGAGIIMARPAFEFW